MEERLEDILKKNVPPEAPKEGVATPEAPTVMPTLPDAAALKEMEAQAEGIAIAAGITGPLNKEVIKLYIKMRSVNGENLPSDQRVLAWVLREVGDEDSLNKLTSTHPNIWTELKSPGGPSNTEPKKEPPPTGIIQNPTKPQY